MVVQSREQTGWKRIIIIVCLLLPADILAWSLLWSDLRCRAVTHVSTVEEVEALNMVEETQLLRLANAALCWMSNRGLRCTQPGFQESGSVYSFRLPFLLPFSLACCLMAFSSQVATSREAGQWSSGPLRYSNTSKYVNIRLKHYKPKRDSKRVGNDLLLVWVSSILQIVSALTVLVLCPSFMPVILFNSPLSSRTKPIT